MNQVKLATPRNMREAAHAENEPIAARGLFSFCRVCGGAWSASAGDYWDKDDDRALECCGEPMILARARNNIIAL